MPVTDTPSRAHQRIVLAVFWVVVSVLEWWQHAAGSRDQPIQKFSQSKLSEAVGELDFTMAEAGWSALHFDSHGNLKIDALTETALADAIAMLQNDSSAPAMARMALLLEKQFGPVASRQVSQLLPALQAYKAAEQRWWQDNGSKGSPAHEELFRLQDQLLGEALAEKLFSEQRRVVNVMLATQRIRNDARLTPAEKEHALIQLQKPVREEGVSND